MKRQRFAHIPSIKNEGDCVKQALGDSVNYTYLYRRQRGQEECPRRWEPAQQNGDAVPLEKSEELIFILSRWTPTPITMMLITWLDPPMMECLDELTGVTLFL